LIERFVTTLPWIVAPVNAPNDMVRLLATESNACRPAIQAGTWDAALHHSTPPPATGPPRGEPAV